MSQIENVSNLYTPGGRFVSGDLDKKQDKDYEGKPVPPEEQEYYFALAIPKNQPGMQEMLATLFGIAQSAYGQHPMVSQEIAAGLNARNFSWKVDDGDIPRTDQKTGQVKEIPDYIKGCWIVKFMTKYDIGACNENGIDIPRTEVKRGDYIDVMYTAGPNGRFDGNAGIKLYPNAVRRIRVGDPISGAVAASQAFAGRAAQVPAGAPETPVGQQQQTQGGMPQQQQTQGGMPMGNSAGNPATTQTQMSDPNAQGGGMPVGQPGGGTVSHSDPAAGVQPHQEILHGPGGGNGVPQNPQGGGMPGT